MTEEQEKKRPVRRPRKKKEVAEGGAPEAIVEIAVADVVASHAGPVIDAGTEGASDAPAAKKPRRSRAKKKVPGEIQETGGGAKAPEAAETVFARPEAPVVERASVERTESNESGGDVGAPDVAGEGAPGSSKRKRSRRGRRRGKKGRPEGVSGEAPPPQGADVPEEGQAVGERVAPGDGGGRPALAGDGSTTSGDGEPGRKKKRRRKRRRGRKGGGEAGAVGPDGVPSVIGGEGTVDSDEDDHGPFDSDDSDSEDDSGDVAGDESSGDSGDDFVSDVDDEAGDGEEGRGKRGRRGKHKFSDEELESTIVEDESAQTKGRKIMMIDGLNPEEQRVAIVSEGNLDYFEVENARTKKYKGNIYKAKVVNIAHAIEAAFLDFGAGRHAFMPLKDYVGGALVENIGKWDESQKRPPLRPGMEILVQVTKEETQMKGAAVTSEISVAGRYLVMMLGMNRFGISKKISGDKERERIRQQMEKLEYPEGLGFIVRTVGANRPLSDLRDDLNNLVVLWKKIVDGGKSQKAPSLIYEEQDIVIRTLRDNYQSSEVGEVFIAGDEAYRKASSFFDIYYPKQKDRLKAHRQKRPLFQRHQLEEQIDRLVSRKVPLPSGGHILIDKTEAMWTIDVNSGKSSKDRDIEDTAFRTNKEAAVEVARHLRLRDIGGLIVVDFIDMDEKGHNREVEKILKEKFRRDKAKTDVTALGKFGLVAISRQRMGTSYYEVLTEPCERCAGTGMSATGDAVAMRVLRKVHDELSRDVNRELLVKASPSLVTTLLNLKREELTRLEKLCIGKVLFEVDAALSPTEFEVKLLPKRADDDNGGGGR